MVIGSLLKKVDPYSVNLQYLLLENERRVLHVGPSLRDLLGYYEQDFINSNIYFPDLMHSDDQDIAIKLFSLNRQDAPKIVNFRCRKADGKIICIQACYQKHYDKSRGLKLVMQLTDAKALNDYLDEPILLSNFTTMMENSEDYIYFKDRNHVFTGASQTLVSVTEPSESWADLIGKTDYDVFPEEYADAYYRLEKQVFSGLPVANEIQKTIDNQGNIGWVDNRKYPILDSQGEIIGLFGIARDVTESIVSQQKLERLYGEKKAILENQLIGIATVKDRKIVWANLAFIDLCGYSLKELLGMSTQTLYVNEQDYHAVGVAYANIESQGVRCHELELLCKDGRKIWVNVSGKLLNKAEGLSLWSFVDVTKLKESELEIKNSDLRFRALFESHGDAVLLLDGNKGIFNCNKAALDIFGCSSRTEFCTKTPAQLSPPQQPCGADSFQLAELRIKAAEEQGSLSFEWVHKRLDDGRLFPAEVLLTTVILDGELIIQGVVRDISERKRIEKERDTALSHLRKISNNVPGMVYQFCLNADGSFSFPYVSAAVQEIFHVTVEGALDDAESLFSKIHPDDYEHFISSIGESKESLSRWHEEFRVRFSDGAVSWLLGTSLPEQRADGVVVWHGFVTDITERKQMEEQIHRLAFYDELTGLANRRLLSDRLNLFIASSKRTGRYGAAFVLDLDNFKPLNDTHGHLVGDLLLIEVARRLMACVRGVDTVARFGGDEFVILLSNLDVDKARARCEVEILANKVLHSLAEPYLLSVSQEGEPELLVEHHCSVSIGVVMFIDHVTSKGDILGWADAAMYQAKDAGRNRVCFYKP